MLKAFLDRVDAYIKATELKPSTVSLYLFNDGKVIDRLKGGGGCDVRLLERAQTELTKREKALPKQAAKTKR